MPRLPTMFSLFFFNDTATTEIYTLSLHDALPIFSVAQRIHAGLNGLPTPVERLGRKADRAQQRSLRNGRQRHTLFGRLRAVGRRTPEPQLANSRGTVGDLRTILL